MACTNVNSSSEIPVSSPENLLLVRSIPLPRYLLIKLEYWRKVIYPSESVSSSLKIYSRSYLVGLILMKKQNSINNSLNS